MYFFPADSFLEPFGWSEAPQGPNEKSCTVLVKFFTRPRISQIPGSLFRRQPTSQKSLWVSRASISEITGPRTFCFPGPNSMIYWEQVADFNELWIALFIFGPKNNQISFSWEGLETLDLNVKAIGRLVCIFIHLRGGLTQLSFKSRVSRLM